MYKNYIEMTGSTTFDCNWKSMEGLLEKENLGFVAATMHIPFCEIYERSP